MFAKTSTLTYSSQIETTPEMLFAFHSDTNNLPEITPPWITVEILDLKPPLQEKSKIKLKITQYHLSQIWQMQIDQMQAPHTICDVALKSPFKYFYHKREFTKIDELYTRLTDTITFVLPLYPWSLVALPLIKRDMDRMFAYRHKKTKEIIR